jgi:putative hemolysin
VGGAIVYFELILGELVPKALALRFTERVALLVAWPVRGMARLSRWAIVILTASTRGVLWLFGMRQFDSREFVSEEEILHLVQAGHDQGVLDPAKSQLLHRVLAFTDTPVRKVMVPRPKLFALDASTQPAEVGRLIVESGFSRIPVYDSSADNFVGLIYAKDALRLLERRQPVILRRILHPLVLVPETKKCGPLLRELQKRRTHMALVIDEHGGVTGLVTLEDLLEEIVGEIDDEYDREERQVERLRDGSLVVEGTVPARELRETYSVPIPESEEFETVAGFVLARLGSLPRGGETVDVDGWRLTVVDVERNRISKIKLEKMAVPSPA